MYLRILMLAGITASALGKQLPICRSYCPNILQKFQGNLVLLVSLKPLTKYCGIWLVFSTRRIQRSWIRLGKTWLWFVGISLNVICRALPSFFVVGNDSSLASNATTKYCESYRARHSATQVIAHLQRASVVDTRRINSKHVFMLSGNQSRESSHNLKLKELEIQYLLWECVLINIVVFWVLRYKVRHSACQTGISL